MRTRTAKTAHAPPLEIFGRGKIVKYAEFLYFFLVSVGENDISNG